VTIFSITAILGKAKNE